MERAAQVRVHRKATTSRVYDAITVCIADLHLSCDLVDDRQVRLAKRLADSHGCAIQISPELAQRVDTALSACGPSESAAGGLFEAIAHGDQEHRDWLKSAIAAFYAGMPVPPPRGAGSKEARIRELEAQLLEVSHPNTSLPLGETVK